MASPSPAPARGPFRKLRKLRESKGAAWLLVFTVLTTGLGFLREAVFAYYFGTSAELDAFLIALTLPKLLAVQVVTISVSVLLPAYVEKRELGDEVGASQGARAWMTALVLILGATSVVIGVFAETAVSILAPGLLSEQAVLAVRWLRMLLPYLFLFGLTGSAKVVLDSHKAYAVPAAANALVIVATIGACLLFANAYGVGALPYAFGVGGFAAFVLHWWWGRRYEPAMFGLRVRSEDLLTLPWAALGWVFVQTMTGQLFSIFDRGFASTLPPGNVSAINYAMAAMAAPTVTTTSVLATVLFPTLAAMVARQEWARAFGMTRRWLGLIVVVAGLGAVALYTFRVEFVDLLFGRGAFDEEAIATTSSIIGVLSITLITSGCSPLLNRLLLALQQFRTVAALAVLTAVLKFGLNYVLIGPFGVVGLAMATVVAGVIGTLLRFGIAWWAVSRASR